MSEEPMDITATATGDLSHRIEELRAGLVNTSADLFFDLSHNLDDSNTTRTAQNFLDYFRLCVMNSPGVFSFQVGPDSLRSEFDEPYSDTELRVFSKWIYRVLGAFLLCPRLISLHSTVCELIKPLFVTLKHNHFHLLAESINILIEMVWKLYNLMSKPGGSFKVSFKYETPRRAIYVRTPVSTIPVNLILNIVDIILPHFDIIKQHSPLLIQFFHILTFLFKRTSIPLANKMKMILEIKLPLHTPFSQARILWCNLIDEVIQMSLQSETEQKSLKTFLNDITEQEFSMRDVNVIAFLVDMESCLQKTILGTVFKDSKHDNLKVCILGIYMDLVKAMELQGLDSYGISRKENSIQFACYVFDSVPLALPIFMEEVHKEMFRLLNGVILVEALNCDFQSRAPIWDTISEKWIYAINSTESIIKDDSVTVEVKRKAFLSLTAQTIGYASLIGSIMSKGNAQHVLSRDPKGGSIDDIIFREEFFQNFEKLLELQTEANRLIDVDVKVLLQWLFIVIEKLDFGSHGNFVSIQTKLIYHTTFPFYPNAHALVPMTVKELEDHRQFYGGGELIEESLKLLGSNIFFSNNENNKETLVKVLHSGMECFQPESVKGILHLMSGLKFICRTLSKEQLLGYLTRLTVSNIWTENEETGILLAKAIGRVGCILTKAVHWNKNGACEVCSTGNHFYEPNNCKMKQVRELIGIIILRGSSSVRMEILDAVVCLKRHGLIPNPRLIGNLLMVIQRPIQFKMLVKLLESSVPILTVIYPNHENTTNMRVLFQMIFTHVRNLLKSFRGELMYNVLVDLVEALTPLSTVNHDLLSVEVSKIIVLVLTLRWSNCIGNKCKLIFRSLAQTRHLKTSEYMGQIREHIAEDFVEICLLEIFGEPHQKLSQDIEQFRCSKCEVVLRGVEHAMEFRREDFIRIYFPILLAHTVPLGNRDRRAELMIIAMAQFALVTVKELLEMHFPFYFPTIAMTVCPSPAYLNSITKFLKKSEVSVTILTSLIFQALMNELLGYFSVDREKVKLLFMSMLLWEEGKLHSIPVAYAENNDIEICNFIMERLMGYFVSLDCKIESPFDNVEMKRRIFSSYVEVISYLGGNRTQLMKMRVSKLLNSCSRKPYLQDLVVHGWKAYTMNLMDDVLPSMMNQILASVLHLQSLSNVGVTPVFEEIANYIISEKLAVTRNFRHQVYYIADHIKNRQTLSLVRNSKYTGMKFLEYLIESLMNGDTHIRYQAMLAVKEVVNCTDTSVNLRQLLEDSQFVHPIVCRLILALLDCAQSQDKDLSTLAIIVFGELGAIDYYRMKVKNMNRQSRRDATAIFPTGMLFTQAYLDMLRKQYQGTELSMPSDIDICAYVVQEIFRIYQVKDNFELHHPIWVCLPQDSKNLFYPFLRSRFTLKDVVPLNVYPSPIYGSEIGRTFQDWCTNFVIQMYTFISSEPAKEIFRVTLPLLVRSLPVATYLLPYVALFAALDGKPHQRLIIYNELRRICRLWYSQAEEDALPISKTETPYSEDSIFEEAAVVDAGVSDRLAVTNAIFSIVDLVSFVSRYGTSNFVILNKVATTGRSGLNKSPPLEGFNVRGDPLTLQNVKDCKCIIPDPICIARAASQTQSYQRALVNLEDFLFCFPEQTQRYLPFLQRIYIALEDIDSVVGASVIRRRKPDIYEETLELLATAKKEDAATKFHVMMQKGLGEFLSENVLIQGYLSIEKPEMAWTIMNGLAGRGLEVGSSPLDDCRIEACWKLQNWGELSSNLKSVRTDLSCRGSLMHAAILSQFQRKRYPSVLDIIQQAREKCLQSLITSDINIDSYHRRYGEITRLHILSEIEEAVALMKAGEERMTARTLLEYRAKVSTFLKNWNRRLDLVQKSLNIIEPIVNTRKALLHIMKDNTSRSGVTKLFASSIRDCWLTVAKLEIRAKNYGRANTCIQEARQFRSPEVFIQDAKFLALRGDMDRGIRIMRECMKQYFPKSKIAEWEASGGNADDPITKEQEHCAKALSLLAKFNDEKCNVDMDINIANYLQVTNVNKRSENNFFQLASYYDTIWSNQTIKQKYSDMQLAVVRFYCKSLEYGSKHVYQSLPRLLFVYFNFASNKPAESYQGQPNPTYQNSMDSYNSIVKEMSKCICDLFNKVPHYIFLTAYSQLISRICHSNPVVWNNLKWMIGELVIHHPHQAIWMMTAVSKSTYKMRKVRCSEIIRFVEEKNPELKKLIQDYNALADQLIGFANKKHDGGKLTSINTIYPSLYQLLKTPNFSSIIMPFQQFLSVNISRVGSHHLTHNPFQQNPVYIQGIEQNVEVMPSLQRPKKITFRGNDGKLYGILCKPSDDLRKDSKVMEMNHIVNWYLGRNPQARERNLHVRTYAVVALNEETGLLEWVPNLQGFRPLLIKLYKDKGLMVGPRDIKEMYPSNNAFLTTILYPAESAIRGFSTCPTTPIECRIERFKQLVSRHPPILREWFLINFSDPQEWYTARTTFTRSAAVMSMVGYLIGLGDRHGENILLDSVSGDVVHVDFNCLFNKGETFDWPERVPFRLTHNMVNAMGPLGYEGPFRRSCELTVEILRQNSAVFMSVLRPFVFDPLVEWSKVRGIPMQPPMSAAATSGEVSNSMAMENIRAIQLRLEGVSRNMTKELNVALSVEAQVSYLLKEATSLANLCQMYMGWGSFY